MGKGGSSSGTTQTIQPSLPNLPNQAQIQSQAQNRLYAGSPWMNSPWRAMDLIGGNAPTQYLPQFTPPGGAQVGGQSPGGGGSQPQSGGLTQGSSGASTQLYPPQGASPQQGVPGFYNPQARSGPPMQMPSTQLGQQALAQNTTPGLNGMMQFLGQLAQQGQPPQGPPMGQGPQPVPPKQVT